MQVQREKLGPWVPKALLALPGPLGHKGQLALPGRLALPGPLGRKGRLARPGRLVVLELPVQLELLGQLARVRPWLKPTAIHLRCPLPELPAASCTSVTWGLVRSHSTVHQANK